MVPNHHHNRSNDRTNLVLVSHRIILQSQVNRKDAAPAHHHYAPAYQELSCITLDSDIQYSWNYSFEPITIYFCVRDSIFQKHVRKFQNLLIHCRHHPPTQISGNVSKHYNSFTRLHPQGKGGPKATFCVRRTKSSQIYQWRILTLYIKFEFKILSITCHKFADFWQIERDRKRRTEDGGRRPYARTSIFLALPTQKAPSGQ